MSDGEMSDDERCASSSESSEEMDEEEREREAQRARIERFSRLPADLRSRMLSVDPSPAAHWAHTGVIIAAPQTSSHHAAVPQPQAAAAAAQPNRSAPAAEALGLSAARPSARASAVRAGDAIRASSKRRGTPNCPPAEAARCELTPKQLYRVDDWEYALTTNSRLLGTYVSLSNVLPDGLAGLGLYASRDFAEGELLGFLWGKFVTTHEWEAICTRHHDATYTPGEEDYVAPVRQGIHRALSVPLQANGADMLLASQQCPAAYINQGHGPETNNVELVTPSEAFDDATSPARAYGYMRVVVRTADGRGVRRDEELTTQYNWQPEAMQRLQELYAAHLNQLHHARTLRGVFNHMRARRVEPSGGSSSVVSHTSADSSQSGSSISSGDWGQSKRVLQQAMLEQRDRDSEQFDYSCCAKKCWLLTTPAWVTNTR
jgi:hypothetical protein